MSIELDKRHILNQLGMFPTGDTITARRSRAHALAGQAAEPAPRIPEMPPEYADRLGKMRYASKQELIARVNDSRKVWRNFDQWPSWMPWRAGDLGQPDLSDQAFEVAISALVQEQQIIVHNEVVALIAEQRQERMWTS